MRALLLQYDIAWQSPGANFVTIEGLLRDAGQAFDVCVLPEMFSTGFTMTPGECPAGTGADGLGKLKEWSRTYDAAFCGSTVFPVDGGYANRFFFVAEGEALAYYDKRHLFRMAGETEAYVAGGPTPVVVSWRGARFLLQVCYDLRFPVTSSNVGAGYDVALYVANWPSTRRGHWLGLLRARAIENQAVVLGVNRVGTDANGLDYAGDTVAYDALGQPLLEALDRPGAHAADLGIEALRAIRERLPFLRDADHFTVHESSS